MDKKNKNFTFVLTGGGSGGHTIPALVMINFWTKVGIEKLYYIGSKAGIEKDVVSEKVAAYFPIYTGKLRRYFSLENFLDLFRFILGIIQSLVILIKLKPDAIFSTGGFVALPVVIAGKLLRIRVVIHEQTTHVGLANKLSSYFADAICISFESSQSYFPRHKTFYTGYPLREVFYQDVTTLQLKSFQNRTFVEGKRKLLILGGGNGSVLLNNFVKNNLEKLCLRYNVILQSGSVGIETFRNVKNDSFWCFSFLEKEMIYLLVSADFVVARAGAGTVCELIHLKKPCLFVPLAIAQKNEQWHNAQEAERLIGSKVISESEWKNLNAEEIIKIIDNLNAKESNLAKPVTILPAHELIDKIVKNYRE